MTGKNYHSPYASVNPKSRGRRRASHVVRLLFFFLGFLARLIAKIARGKTQTILLVRLDLLGDFVLFAPALKAIRGHFVGRKIVLLVQDRIAGFARTCPYVDEVIPVDIHRYRVNPAYALRVLLRVWSLHCATSINSMYSRTLVGDEIVMWSSADTTIGWLGVWGDVHADLKRLHDRKYTRLIPDQFDASTHEFQRHCVLLRELGHEQGEDLRPGLWEVPSLGSLNIPVHDLVESGKFVVVVPGADTKIRRWPFSAYLELTRRISDRFPEMKIVLLGTLDEKQLGGIDGSSTFPAQVLDLRGKTALLDVPIIINSARLVIGNDTGPIHLAIALGTPSVAVLGGGNYGRFMPYGEPIRHRTVTNHLDCFHCDWHCSRKAPECIVDVPVVQVWEEVVGMLEQSEKPLV